MRYETLILLTVLAGCRISQPANQSVNPTPHSDVQRFGPVIYVQTDRASPDPETYRSQLFSENANGRRDLIRALGLNDVPEFNSAWQEFLKAHPEKGEDALLGGFASASIMDEPLEPGSRQAVLNLGFNEDTENPFGIFALFDQRNGKWRQLGTFACACVLGYSIDPLDDPKHRAPVHDLVIGTTTGVPNVGRGYVLHEDHFRMKDERLHPTIDFEPMREECPAEVTGGPTCTVWETFLEKEMLVDPNGRTKSGFALVTMTGHPSAEPCRMCALILRRPSCKAFLWDDEQTRYVPTDLVPAKCGEPLKHPRVQRRIPRDTPSPTK